MRVYLGVGDSWAELGNDGITLRVLDNQENQVGRLRIGKATVEWCAKNKKMGNGKKVRLDKLIEIIDEQ